MSEHNDSSPTTSSPYRSAPGTPKRESSPTIDVGQYSRLTCDADCPLVPFKPPQRRSSLAFSQLLTSTPTNPAMAEDIHTPNVGRKRTHATPFMRGGPTPGHTSRIQCIFHDATTMMQLDAAYASSPVGSIDSRISPLSATTPGRVPLPTSPGSTNWRYSTAPQSLAEAESDVREPFPTIEPPSSGHLAPLPQSSSPESIGCPSGQCVSPLSDPQNDTDIYPAAAAELDRQLSELHVNQRSSAPSSYYDVAMLEESPDPVSALSTDLDIFCSPAATAAAESAKIKRTLHSLGHTDTKADHDHPSFCPDPSLHQSLLQSNVLVPGPSCPDPSVHRRIQQSDGLAVPRPHPCRRANSRGSPLPPPKAKHLVPNQHYHSSPPRSGYKTLPVPARPHFQPHLSPPPLAEHFQPGWSNFPVQSVSPGAYSFSTEAARITGSSAAPDSRIRDSYRTDTLTPLAKPKARYKKTGIAAMTHGVGKYYGVRFGQSSRPVQFGSSPPRPMTAIPKKRMSDPGRRGAEDVILEADAEDLQELSPNVTPYRKGREPKRPRRKSYWDKDILKIEDKENHAVAGDAHEESEMLLDKDDY